MNFEERADELFLDFPEKPGIDKTFSNISKVGKLIYLSGQLPYSEGRLSHKGRVGLELTLDAGRSAARTATVQALGVLRGELKSLNKIKRIVHLDLYIATGAEFKDHKKVLMGSSDLLQEIFGSCGKSSANVAGVASLPEGAPVQLAMIVEVK